MLLGIVRCLSCGTCRLWDTVLVPAAGATRVAGAGWAASTATATARDAAAGWAASTATATARDAAAAETA